MITRLTGLTVNPPSDQIAVKAPSLEVWRPSRAVLVGADEKNGAATLLPAAGQGTVGFSISEGDSAPGWLDGLRGIGGMTIPVIGGFFSRLATLLPFAVLWWSLARVARLLPGVRVVVMARSAAAAIVVALAAVAFFRLAFHLSETLGKPDWVSAGPLGLLVGGSAIIWPVACWRIRPAGPVSHPAKASPGWLRRILPARAARLQRLAVTVLMHLTAVVAYIAVIYGCLTPHTFKLVDSVPAYQVVLTALLVTALAASLTYVALGCWTWSTGLVSALFSAVVLAATVAWPMLWYNFFFGNRVNHWGKWMFLVVAVIVAGGLCVMSVRITLAVFDHCRLRAASRPDASGEASGPRLRIPWRAVLVAAVVISILAAVLPDVVSQSGVADPHATGLVPYNLFDWFDALPQMLSWLALLLGIVVAAEIANLPPQLAGIPGALPGSLQRADTRLAARDLALPIALQLMYWDDRWFYLPVTIIAGVFLVRYLLMPRRLAVVRLRSGTAGTALKDALAGWHTAEFTGGQRVALLASSTEVLRDAIVNETTEAYQDRLTRLISAQEDLGSRHDGYQRTARAAKLAAFSYQGAEPDLRAARSGSLVGAILGIVPVAITLLTTVPQPGSTGYPILDFLGTTAWSLLAWAGLGWFIGYYLPLIRGGNGTEKGGWAFLTMATASLPASLVWNDTSNWTSVLVSDLQLLVFLLVVTVTLADLRALRNAGLRLTDWPRVYNWRFVATWSTALLTAVGTIAIAFATTTVTDISQQLTPPTGSSGAAAASSAATSGSASHGGSGSQGNSSQSRSNG